MADSTDNWPPVGAAELRASGFVLDEKAQFLGDVLRAEIEALIGTPNATVGTRGLIYVDRLQDALDRVYPPGQAAD